MPIVIQFDKTIPCLDITLDMEKQTLYGEIAEDIYSLLRDNITRHQLVLDPSYDYKKLQEALTLLHFMQNKLLYSDDCRKVMEKEVKDFLEKNYTQASSQQFGKRNSRSQDDEAR